MSFFWQAILIEGGLAVVAAAAALLFDFDYTGHVRFHWDTLYGSALALLPLIAVYFILQALPFNSLKRIDRIVRELFWQHMNYLTLSQLALIAALAGIGEELFFRGLLQLELGTVWGLTPWMAAVIVSVIFGLAHAVTPAYCFAAFFISLYLGFLLIETNNLIIPIAVHALYDFFVFLYVKWTPQKNA